MDTIRLNDWRLLYAKNDEVIQTGFEPLTVEALTLSGYPVIDAKPPSCFELELYRAGVVDDPYYGDNVWKMRPYEYYHQWYFARFDCPFDAAELILEGVDTVADVIVNGVKAARTENMFVPCRAAVDDPKREGNEVIVHVYPAVVEARKYAPTAAVYAQKYAYPSLFLRKSPSSFGWDILPRLPCGGLWRPVELAERARPQIEEFYLSTARIAGGRAMLILFYRFAADGDLEDYSLRLEGKCGDSVFAYAFRPWHTAGHEIVYVDNPRLWNPAGYGEQNLYDVRLTLYKDGGAAEEKTARIGIRTAALIRTPLAGKDGKFEFEVNGRKVFVLGANWVPVDALHERDEERALKALGFARDLGCNLIRVWGGGTYECDAFYDRCDELGILVWQDFMLACAVYPEDEALLGRIKREAEYQVRRLRTHPSLLIWSGDNECDSACMWQGERREPFHNRITREIIADAIRFNDAGRPYLPSSPYMDEIGFTDPDGLSENHLWGMRDYFKGEYYRNARCLFSSEIGYPGCSSPSSMKKFLREPRRLFDENGAVADEVIAHATSPGRETQRELYGSQPNRILKHLKNLFRSVPGDPDDFIRASQISQAEAFKYFIERFRIRRNTHGGIVWWNLIEGWPQGFNNDVVDFYFVKKLAYHYIKRSQAPVCLMCDEEPGTMYLYGVNDTAAPRRISYTVTDLYAGKKVAAGERTLKSDFSELIDEIGLPANDKTFYLIEWTDESGRHSNHFHTDIAGICFDRYARALRLAGYDEWEGFADG